jgi:hypothetical protein
MTRGAHQTNLSPQSSIYLEIMFYLKQDIYKTFALQRVCWWEQLFLSAIFFHQGHRSNFITGVTKLRSLSSKGLKSSGRARIWKLGIPDQVQQKRKFTLQREKITVHFSIKHRRNKSTNHSILRWFMIQNKDTKYIKEITWPL